MKHFHGIEGLRAWLAWTVVISHIFLLTAASTRWPILHTLDNAAIHAVSVFIIISGFVITHLIIEKKEPYLPYITRRFLRIYPVYIICLIFGIFATKLHIEAFSSHPWGEWMPQPEYFAVQAHVFKGHGFISHLLAHIFLIQGLFSNNVLNESEFMFLGPAWSLSLEWQFYLVAPLVLFLLRYPWGKIIVPLIIVAGFCAYTEGWLGDFESPCILPGAGLLFAVGIATRLIIPKLPRTSAYPVAAIIVACSFIKMTHALLPFVFWGAFIAWMIMDRAADKISGGIKKIMGWAFDSKIAHFLGERSYSTYLIHYPLIHVISFVCVKYFAFGMEQTVLVELVLAPLLTLLAAVMLYKYIEAPTIAYGKRLFNESPN